MSKNLISLERVVDRILLIRDQRVLLDSELAQLYGVDTKILTKAVKRNTDRFPSDFIFQLTIEETGRLRFQNGTSNNDSSKRGGRRYRPYVFTEQGVAMLSTVLRSKQAVAVNIEIMRAFVEMRRMAEKHRDLSKRLDTLEQKYDSQFSEIFRILKSMILPPEEPRKQIGFKKE